MRIRLVSLAGLFFCACATVPKADQEQLKPTIEGFHKAVRWKDYRQASDLLVPELRTVFTKERLKLDDDKNLTITEYELEDARVASDGMSASVVSKVSWFRLPDTTVKSATPTSQFVWREAHWLLESMDEGPFPELKPAPDAAPKKKPSAPPPAGSQGTP